jgi:hypothetical protein
LLSLVLVLLLLGTLLLLLLLLSKSPSHLHSAETFTGAQNAIHIKYNCFCSLRDCAG